MRSLALTFCLLLGAVLCAQAQQQEAGLSQRLNRSGQDLIKMAYDTRQSTFGNHEVSTKKATAKEFGGNRSFIAKDFSSKPFGGTKSSWFSGLFFGTKSASTKGNFEVAKFGGEKTAATKSAWDGDKPMETASFVPGDHPYLKRDRFDSSPRPMPSGTQPVGYTGSLQPMTINDIRELLNKNK